MVKEGDKVARIIQHPWSDDKKSYKVLEIVKVTKTGRMNLSDGTVINPNFTQRGSNYNTFPLIPKYVPLTEGLEKEILAATQKREELYHLLKKIEIKELDETLVEKLLQLLKENNNEEFDVKTLICSKEWY